MDLLLAAVMAVAAIVFIGWPLINPRRYVYYFDDMLALGEQKTLNYLQSQRSVVYDNLRDLDQEHEMGKLSETDYMGLRAGLLAEAQNLIRQIDEVHARREIETLIEDDARKYRRTE